MDQFIFLLLISGQISLLKIISKQNNFSINNYISNLEDKFSISFGNEKDFEKINCFIFIGNNFFLPIILLLKIFNFFFEFRISKIPNDLGGIIVLYPYFIKKEKGYFKNKLHIFYISNIDRVYKNESLYNLFWLKCLFNHLSPVKIENKKLFFCL